MIKRSVLFFFALFLLISLSCFEKNNPVNAKKDNIIDIDNDGVTDSLDSESSINTPKINFMDSVISSFVNDTVTITVKWSDVDSGSKQGSITKFLWDLNGDGTFEKETTSDTLKEPFSADTFMVYVKCIDAQGIESKKDSLKLFIALSPPTITAMQDTTVAINDTVILYATGSDSNGSITNYLWSFDNKVSYDTTSDSTYKKVWSVSDTGNNKIYVRAMDDDNILSTFDDINVQVKLYAPKVSAMHDTTVAINDTVVLYATGRDNNGSITNYLWSFNNKVSYDTTSDSTYKKVWSVSDTGNNKIYVRAMDDDNLLSTSDDINVQVKLYAPIANAGNDTTVGINDNVVLHGSGSTDETSVTSYAWKCGNGSWLTDADGDTTVTAPSTAQMWACSLKITDDDGNIAYDVMNVTVETRPPTANAGNDTTVGINDNVVLHGSGTDETAISSYAWKCGNGNWVADADGNTTVIAPSTAQTWVCSLKVTDDEGNVAYDIMNVIVETRPPTANAGNDTAVVINADVALHGSGTDETAISSYAWKCGNGNWVADADGNTTVTAPSTAQTWVCSLKVTDNEGNVAYDIMNVTVFLPSQLISAGGACTMILRTDSTLWACGHNSSGQLGDGTTTNRSTPVQIMTSVENVSAGGACTMILKTGGTLWACGYNNHGQLGDGTTTSRSTPVQIMTSVKNVSAGEYHTMILKTDGTLWACGYNLSGQLGDGTTTDRHTPVPIMASVENVSAGGVHSMILRTDGTLWACGSNSYGQLGDGTTTDKTTPVQIMTSVKDVSAGCYHTMILKTDGTLWACGRNYYGQLGDGTTASRSTPVQIMTSVEDVSAGGYYTMILKTDGTLWACGSNYYGQLGDGTTTDRHTPVQIIY